MNQDLKWGCIFTNLGTLGLWQYVLLYISKNPKYQPVVVVGRGSFAPNEPPLDPPLGAFIIYLEGAYDDFEGAIIFITYDLGRGGGGGRNISPWIKSSMGGYDNILTWLIDIS